MITISTIRKAFALHQFNTLTLVNNGVILNSGKKSEKEILYSELDKIYIKRNNLNPIIELMLISLPFLLIYIVLQYAPFEMLIIASFFSIFPVFIAVHNYKWYVLKLRLKDGTTHCKRVSLHLKSESVSIMDKVYCEHLHYQANRLMSA
ncbi:hypothetical protein [Flavobacterium nackdongense]|uniref:Uncharacterized protein n=1 Tax=Flavobacterium nackdongense TaxID=2547394 RepID=A0A4P6YBJ4_9FLAO|nr:hypothetical protein [Flavobacterium nackdongense]QBN20439.1 hypothetical protein E1750_17125 [Flavobacterium nackdongense]